jgi:signal transduction histidine kinase
MKLPRWLGPEFQLILVFVLISGALGITGYRFGAQVERNGNIVQVAGRQRLEIQRIMRWLLEVGAASGAARDSARAELRRDFDAMNEIMSALRDGGDVRLGPTTVLSLARDSVPTVARPTFEQLDQQWQKFAGRIGPLVDADRAPDDVQLQKALEYGRAAEPALSGLASRFVGEVSIDSFRTAGQIRVLQLVGAGIAVFFFFFLVYLYSRQLKRVRSAQKETDEILQTVPAGLFLLDRQVKLGAQHSAQLEKILQRGDLKGADFFAVLSGMVASETLVTARDYIGLLLGDRVNEHLVASLNPLDEVEVQVAGDAGRPEKRWLGFAFRRVLENGKLTHLLVTVTDVTDRVLLSRKLEQVEAQSDQQAERLLDLFLNLTHVEQGLLEVRLERWERLLREANEVLKHQAGTQNEFHQLINQVFRPIHALKGEAAALDLGVIVQRAQAVERELADLRTREAELSGNDFLPVTVRLEDLFAQFDAVRKVTRRLSELSRSPSAAIDRSGPLPEAPQRHSAWDMALDLTQRAAQSLGKQVKLEMRGLDDAMVPEHLRQPLLDVLLQLVRNAVAHGIEMPQERTRAGKAPAGKLDASFSRAADGSFEFSFRDDGRGIDFERIRQRAVSLGKMSAEQAQQLQPRQLAALIFEPGFSTADLPGDTAGRGVGLDLVRDRIKRLGGQVGVGTGPGQYTQFKVRLPAAA